MRFPMISYLPLAKTPPASPSLGSKLDLIHPVIIMTPAYSRALATADQPVPWIPMVTDVAEIDLPNVPLSATRSHKQGN